MSLFDYIFEFFVSHGLKITLLAVGGIFLLGCLKYANVFKKFDANIRHSLYFIAIAFYSFVSSSVYLFIEKEFSWSSMLSLSVIICSLNQTAYNIFKTTTLKDLLDDALEKFKWFLLKKFSK